MHEIINDRMWPWGPSEGGAMQMDSLSESLVHAIHHCLILGPQCYWLPGRSVPLESAGHLSSWVDLLCLLSRGPVPSLTQASSCLPFDVFSHVPLWLFSSLPFLDFFPSSLPHLLSFVLPFCAFPFSSLLLRALTAF